MTLTLDLPPDLEEHLNSEAARRGLSPSGYLLELVKSTIPGTGLGEDGAEAGETGVSADTHFLSNQSNGARTESAARPRTGAEIVEKWRRKGLIGTRPDIKDSVEYVREMRRRAETRDWS